LEVVGLTGLVVVTVTFPAEARLIWGIVTVSEVPGGVFGVNDPPVIAKVPKLTTVEVLRPVPVNVIVWSVVAPAIRPRAGLNEARVGTALSRFTVSIAVLSVPVGLESFESETVASLRAMKPVAAGVVTMIALGATDTFRIRVLLPTPAGASIAPLYTQFALCGFCGSTLQVQPLLFEEKYFNPVGNEADTLTGPFVGPVPLLVTLIVYVPFELTTKSVPAAWVIVTATSGVVITVG
jgi:hypothetical protein